MSTRKVLAIASGGGHWIQLRRLSPAFAGLDIVYVSVFASNQADVPENRYYNVRDVSRWARLGFVVLGLQCLRILLIERPSVVVTTGSAPGLVMLVLAKSLFRCKTLWLDSVANCEELSLSGQKARRFADVWLTQWPELQSDVGPDYWGAVI